MMCGIVSGIKLDNKFIAGSNIHIVFYTWDPFDELQNSDGSRVLPIDQFITGPKKTILKPGEILSAVRVKIPPAKTIQHFEKVGKREALAIAVASFAALVELADNGSIASARFAWGSIGPTVFVSQEINDAVVGRRLDEKTLDEAGSLLNKLVNPIDDVRATAEYRRLVASRLMLRLLNRSV